MATRSDRRKQKEEEVDEVIISADFHQSVGLCINIHRSKWFASGISLSPEEAEDLLIELPQVLDRYKQANAVYRAAQQIYDGEI